MTQTLPVGVFVSATLPLRVVRILVWCEWRPLSEPSHSSESLSCSQAGCLAVAAEKGGGVRQLLPKTLSWE